MGVTLRLSNCLQRTQRRLHRAVVPTALCLCYERRKAWQQFQEIAPDIISQGLCEHGHAESRVSVQTICWHNADFESYNQCFKGL